MASEPDTRDGNAASRRQFLGVAVSAVAGGAGPPWHRVDGDEQRLGTVVHHGITPHAEEARAAVAGAIDGMVAQLHDRAPGAADCRTYHASSTEVDTDAPLWFGEAVEGHFVRECLRVLHREGVADPGDAWVIVDTIRRFGYGSGRHSVEASDGGRIHGARVFFTPSSPFLDDPLETFRNLAVHEMGHVLGAGHAHGSYDADGGIASDVTPMATAYAGIDDGECDTTIPGSGDWPAEFCDGTENEEVGTWCGGAADGCRHDPRLTRCTVDAIADATPL